MTHALTDYPGYRFSGEAVADLLGDTITVTIEAGYLDEDGLLTDRAVVETHTIDSTTLHHRRLYDTLTDTLRALLPDWEWQAAVEQHDADDYRYTLHLGGMVTCREVPTIETLRDDTAGWWQAATGAAVATVDRDAVFPGRGIDWHLAVLVLDDGTVGLAFTEHEQPFITCDNLATARDAFDFIAGQVEEVAA